MPKKPVILIVSSSRAASTHVRVSSCLESYGWNVITYESDLVLAGKTDFALSVAANGSVEFLYQGNAFNSELIVAAWYWKVGQLHPYDGGDLLKKFSIDREMARVNEAVWQLVPDGAWLDSPSALRLADGKLRQLRVATSVGFKVPDTLITNSWSHVNDLLTRSDHIAAKMFQGMFADERNRLMATYTANLDEERVRSLSATTLPFPAIFQPFVEKRREWRITLVGDRVFSAAIYTDTSARDDWRRLQLTKAVRFVAETPPVRVEELCRAYNAAQELSYGAFDLIEAPDGEFIFLECNPIGQFAWLEDQLGLPVSAAIAEELEARARKNFQDRW